VTVGTPGANRGKTYPAEALTPDETRALLDTCSRRAPTGIRNRALIVLMWRGGLRIAEALALRPCDLNADEGTVTVMRGKGHRRRVVALDDGALAEVLLWVDRRSALGIGARKPLLCTLAGKPVKAQYVRTMLARCSRKAGIERRVNPHALRHTFAVELAREETPLTVIQKALGHASLAATATYLDHLAPTAVIDTLRARPSIAA
jgi:site-specific recombinase XerD